MKLLNCHIIVTVLVLTSLPTIICAVNGYQWHSPSFGPISLDSIDNQARTREGSATIILDVNTNTTEDATIAADNSSAAQLHNATDHLVTKYKLEFDGDGSTKTGGISSTEYVSYESFLSPGVTIKHVPGDDSVTVTLWVEASNIADNVADSGKDSAKYFATQTLTVTW